MEDFQKIRQMGAYISKRSIPANAPKWICSIDLVEHADTGEIDAICYSLDRRPMCNLGAVPFLSQEIARRVMSLHMV